jgi:hypothetical protein
MVLAVVYPKPHGQQAMIGLSNMKPRQAIIHQSIRIHHESSRHCAAYREHRAHLTIP